MTDGGQRRTDFFEPVRGWRIWRRGAGEEIDGGKRGGGGGGGPPPPGSAPPQGPPPPPPPARGPRGVFGPRLPVPNRITNRLDCVAPNGLPDIHADRMLARVDQFIVRTG